MKRFCLVAVAIVLSALAAPAGAVAPATIVAAENFYGDVAQQIGGPQVRVTSILSNPDEDPHLFEASPSAARAIAEARIVVYNGIDYDPWVGRLLRTTPNPGRTAIVVADLIGRKPGDNPHIWYDPATMPALAKALAAALESADPAHRTDYRDRLRRFEQSMRPIAARIAALRGRLAGTPVAATEPVFGYMFGALGMAVRNRRFQLSVMNNTEPRASDVAAFEDDLKQHRVRLLVYNRQATGVVARRMVAIARDAHIPTVAVSETEPQGQTYQAWMTSALDAIEQALPP